MFETGESLSAISKFDSVLEKNQLIYIVNSVLSLLSLRCIDVIQSAIVVRLFYMVLIVFSSDV